MKPQQKKLAMVLALVLIGGAAAAVWLSSSGPEPVPQDLQEAAAAQVREMNQAEASQPAPVETEPAEPDTSKGVVQLKRQIKPD